MGGGGEGGKDFMCLVPHWSSKSSEQSLDAKTSIWGIHKCNPPLRRLEALRLAPRVGNANQDASQHFGNTKPSAIQFNARVQALGDSVLCFKHEASLCSGLREHLWGHRSVTVGEAKWRKVAK